MNNKLAEEERLLQIERDINKHKTEYSRGVVINDALYGKVFFAYWYQDGKYYKNGEWVLEE